MVANLTAQQNAIQMLSERVAFVHEYIRGVQHGTAKRDEEALRQIAALLASVPNMKQVPEFRDEYLTVSSRAQSEEKRRWRLTWTSALRCGRSTTTSC